jgi:hypothetical protein
MIVGGVIAGIGLRNPRTELECEACRAAAAGEGGRCAKHLGGRPRREAEPVAEPT